MIAQAIATVLMLIVFMFGFTYFLNSLFFRRIEKHDREQTKKNANIKTTTRLNARVSTYYVKNRTAS
ncbi:hypothetical protein O209_11655 [Lactiplantibacillus plantarum WHE 92]|nr:hypothetical protein O209_11655 [Lactiplantibacillus plantarum WHE 92]